MDKTECLTISSKTFKFKNIDEDTAILEEYDNQRHSITNKYLIEYWKMFDKMILSNKSLDQLKILAELVNEVIEEKLKEG
jgi:hypothetical protein